VQCRYVLAKPIFHPIASGMILLHPELPVAVWIKRKPALADKELEHRAQRTDRLKDLARVSECVCGPEEAALATDEADDRAAVPRDSPPSQTALGAADQEILVDAAHVEER
jgi:hypothetical protein